MLPFRKLILITMGQATSFRKDPSPRDWREMYQLSRQQALVGVLNDTVHRLHADQTPPEALLREWDENTAKIGRIYHLHEEHAKELEALLTRLGLHGCILKGTGLARLYPNPERRMCGDIDLWIKGKRDDIIEAFENADIPIYDIIYQECKAGVFLDTEVEIHFHPSKMYNPFSNARLQRFFEENSPIRDDVPITYPSARFNAVFCMAHMFRHYLEGGIGMRQMWDYYYILQDLPRTFKKPVMKTLKRLGMGKFTAAVMYLMKTCFGLDKHSFLCSPDEKRGKRLVKDVLAMGNFGVMDERNYEREGEGKWARFMRKNRRVFSNLRFYPREVIWSPFARVSQYVWRWFKGYL